MNYYSEAQGGVLREALEAQVLHWPEVSARRMFGCPAYTADGRLFVFVVNEGLVLTQLRLHDGKYWRRSLRWSHLKPGSGCSITGLKWP
jgi:hypothetical protein